MEAEVEAEEVVGVRSTSCSEGWFEVASGAKRSCGACSVGSVTVLSRGMACEAGVDSSSSTLMRFDLEDAWISLLSANGFANAASFSKSRIPLLRFLTLSSSGFDAMAVVVAASFLRFPSLLTRLSKLALLIPPLSRLLFASKIRPLASISSRALRLLSAASGLSSGLVEESGGDGDAEGLMSSPRLCRATVILRRELSSHSLTWGFS